MFEVSNTRRERACRGGRSGSGARGPPEVTRPGVAGLGSLWICRPTSAFFQMLLGLLPEMSGILPPTMKGSWCRSHDDQAHGRVPVTLQTHLCHIGSSLVEPHQPSCPEPPVLPALALAYPQIWGSHVLTGRRSPSALCNCGRIKMVQSRN